MRNIVTGAICGTLIALILPAWGIITEPRNADLYLLLAVVLVGVLGGIGALVGALVTLVRK